MNKSLWYSKFNYTYDFNVKTNHVHFTIFVIYTGELIEL